MALSEQALQKKILTYLDSMGCWTVKTISCNKNGVCDILCCYRGRFVAFEVKRQGKLREVSKIQQYQINKINEAGGSAHAVDSLEKVVTIVETLSNTGET